MSFYQLKVVFQSPYKRPTLFRFKTTLDKKFCPNFVYRYSCSNCNSTYYGRTYQYFFTRAAEHVDISNLTGKRFKSVKEFLTTYGVSDCTVDFDHLDILVSDTNSFRLLTKESLTIKHDKPVLNRTVKSFTFWLIYIVPIIFTILLG